MSQNIYQIFQANPASSMISTDILYFGRSPYDTTDDFAITFANFVASIGVTTPTASTIPLWDANKNLSAVGFIAGYATTVTSASPVILVVGSAQQQYFTGSTAQTVIMPVTSTLVLGQQWLINNSSSANLTVESSGTNSIVVLPAGTQAWITCILTSGTTAASWSNDYILNVAGVSSITGTTNEIIASASTGGVILSAPQSLATTAAFQVNTLQLNNSNGILDANGNELLTNTAIGSAVNFINLSNAASGGSPIFSAEGTDSNIGIIFTTKATSSFLFNSSTLANYINLVPAATGTSPTIQFGGSDTNVGAIYTTKGTGSHLFYIDTVPAVAMLGVASAVNYIQYQNASTGNSPSITATGTDGNVGLVFQVKATQAFNFTSSTLANQINIAPEATGVPPEIVFTGSDTNVSGSIYLKAAGTLNVVSSTLANYLNFAPAATGLGPTITALGSDNNIGMILDAKGTGFIYLMSAQLANGIAITPAATGSVPGIVGAGTDTNIGTLINTKGTGQLSLFTGNTANLVLIPATTPVNFIQITSAATTNSPQIEAVGSDNNVILTLLGKGTGGVTLAGTTAADNAAAGYVGEMLTSTFATAVAMTSTQTTQIETLTLTAGDWDVWGNFYTAVGATTTQSLIEAQLHTSTATIAAPTTAQLASIVGMYSTVTTGKPIFMNTGISRWNVSGSTTVYLNANATYATSTLTGNGSIYARRVR